MRMGINEFSAKEVINNLEIKKLEKIFKFFGEENEAKKLLLILARKENIKELILKL